MSEELSTNKTKQLLVPIPSVKPLDLNVSFNRYGGTSTLNRRERNHNLRGPRKYLTFNAIKRQLPIVGSSIEAIKRECSSAVWDFEPYQEGDNEPTEEAQATTERFRQEFIDNYNYSWEQVIRQCVDYKYYGFNLLEWQFGGTRGNYTFKKLQQIPHHLVQQDWILGQTPKDKGDVLGVRVSGDTTVVVPRQKLIYLVEYGSDGHHSGSGAFDDIANQALKAIARANLLDSALQISTVGYLKIKIPELALSQAVSDKLITEERAKEKVDEFKNAAEKIYLGDEVPAISYPSDVYNALDADGNIRPSTTPQWDIERALADPGGIKEQQDQYVMDNFSIARRLGTTIQLIGEAGTGSLALAQVVIRAEENTVDSINKYIVKTLQRDLINVFAELNGIPENEIPTLTVSSAKGLTIEGQNQLVLGLFKEGAISSDHPAIKEILQKNELETLEEEEQNPRAAEDRQRLIDNPPTPQPIGGPNV